MGALLQQAKTLQEKRVVAKSALAKAVLAGETRTVCEKIRDLLERVRSAWEKGLHEIDALDARWPGVEADELEQLASALTFLGRWRDELTEWEFKLAHE